MKTPSTLAFMFITLCCATSGAIGQKVYRCGNDYSQVPCADGLIVQADDPRSSIQKAQSDAMTQRTSAAAQALEKTRLEHEAALKTEALAAEHAARLKKKKYKEYPHAAKVTNATTVDSAGDNDGPRRMKKSGKKKGPEFFTARVAPTPKKDKKALKE